MMRGYMPFLALGFASAGGSVFGHHSFAVEYDRNQPVTLRGTVTRVDWVNPHAHVFMDVTNVPGRVTNWQLELGSPQSLSKMGWTRDSLKTGDRITIKGFRARDGSHLVNVNMITRSDGKILLAANGDADSRAVALLKASGRVPDRLDPRVRWFYEALPDAAASDRFWAGRRIRLLPC